MPRKEDRVPCLAQNLPNCGRPFTGFSGDDGLVQAFRAGAPRALEIVYRSHAAAVGRAVAAMLRRYGASSGSWSADPDDVADLVQDVFVRAFEPGARHRYDSARSYGPYLYGIARHVVVDFLRRRRRQWSDRLTAIDEDALSVAAAAAGQELDLSSPELESLVSRCVSRLPLELRRVHDALYVQGLSQRGAAAALRLGRQSIRTLENKLTEILRRELEQRTARITAAKPSRRPSAR